MVDRNPTRAVSIGPVTVGGGNPVAVQSMCATHTQDVDATVEQADALHAAGAGVVRLAVDSKKDAEAVAEIAQRTSANLCIDLQESYRLATEVAPHVAKLRYNPGHLYHHEKHKSAVDKAAFIAETAGAHDCAVRVGVNCGSVDPVIAEKFGDDSVGAMVASAVEHCGYLEDVGFERYVVSLKDSDPNKVIEGNQRFAAERPDVPLHLGVTEAGLLPDGAIKTRIAFEQLLTQGIGDTIRVSLTLANEHSPLFGNSARARMQVRVVLFEAVVRLLAERCLTGQRPAVEVGESALVHRRRTVLPGRHAGAGQG